MTQKIDYVGAIHSTHDEIINELKPQLTSEEDIYEMSDTFKAFSDPTRLRIIDALINAELCVCCISSLLELSQPAVSHHLKALRQARIVKSRREGKEIYYSLDDEHIRMLFELCRQHIAE